MILYLKINTLEIMNTYQKIKIENKIYELLFWDVIYLILNTIPPIMFIEIIAKCTENYIQTWCIGLPILLSLLYLIYFYKFEEIIGSYPYKNRLPWVKLKERLSVLENSEVSKISYSNFIKMFPELKTT